MNDRYALVFGLILAIFYIDASHARNMDIRNQQLINREAGAGQYVQEDTAEKAAREVFGDVEVDDDEQRDFERRQRIPSGSFHGACFFDDAFGGCPKACRKDGHPRGGRCINFKCLCY